MSTCDIDNHNYYSHLIFDAENKTKNKILTYFIVNFLRMKIINQTVM